MINSRLLASLLTGTASVILIQCIVPSGSSPDRVSQPASISLSFGSPASANTSQPNPSHLQYNPPDRGAPLSTRGTGSRTECKKDLPVFLNLLVPNNHIGQSTLGRPTFSWYVTSTATSTLPIEFTLVEPGNPVPIFVKEIESQNSGFMQLEVPQEVPELTPGKKYRWSVSVICNRNRSSENVFAQGWVERVEATPQLERQLQASNSERDRASIYAREGVWYDAVSLILRNRMDNPNDRSALEDTLSLIEQAGLNDLAAQERDRLARQ